jgi:uncharacterized membrane-anchored protein
LHPLESAAFARRTPKADLGYWICMFISGTLGTVIGDFCSHNMGLDDAGASILLSSWRCCSWQDAVGGLFCCRFIG